MRFMILVKATEESEVGVMPTAQLLADMGRYNQELVKAGVLLARECLHPSSEGVRIRFSGKERTVIDGPFEETNELVAGFWLVQVRSKDEVLEWARRCPNPMPGGSEIEVRQCVEPDDFGDALTGKLRTQEERRRNGRT
jgi:hypothetical protein